MSINLLHGCFQIESGVHDLDAASRFMRHVLGAGLSEQQLAREIGALVADFGHRIDHFDCGDALFQVNQPSPTMIFEGQKSVHMRYLESIGGCIANLNYYVDDIAHAHGLLTQLGSKTNITGPSSTARSLADYGPDNTRPGADERPFYFMATRHLIGLDLEIMEPNFLRLGDQTAQNPCFVEGRRSSSDGNLRLLRLRLVVADLHGIYRNIARIFAPASRSNAYAVRETATARAFRISLGGLELEYCQPLTDTGPLAEHLARYGDGVISAEFGARNLDDVLDRARASIAVDIVNDGEWLGLDASPDRHLLSCRAILGFDVVLAKLGEGLSCA